MFSSIILSKPLLNRRITLTVIINIYFFNFLIYNCSKQFCLTTSLKVKTIFLLFHCVSWLHHSMTTWRQMEDITIMLPLSCALPNHPPPLEEELSQTLKIIPIVYTFLHHYNNFGTLHISGDWPDDSQKSEIWPQNYFISFSWSSRTKSVICKTMNSCRKPSVHFLLLWIFLSSQNHSILHVAIDFRGHLFPPSTESMVNTELIAGCSGLGQTGFENPHGQKFHRLSRQPPPMPNYPISLKSEPLDLCT